jgi:hypothetical protein
LIRSQFNGMERKIIDANLQKGICATIDFKNHIAHIRNTIYSNDFIQNIEDEIKVVKEKNDNEFRQLENEFNQSSYRLSKSAVDNLRIKLYHLVDNKENKAQLNITDSKSLLSPFYSDQEKKIKFIAKCYNTYVFDKLSQDYADSTQKSVGMFTINVKENLNKMQSNIKQITFAKLSSDFDNHAIVDFYTFFSFDMNKLGSNAANIGGPLLLGLIFATGPLAITLVVVTALIASINVILGGEKPEAKAKKQIDEKLSSMKTEVRTKLDSNNKSTIEDCEKNVIDKVRIMLSDNINGIKAIQSILDSKTNQLEELIKEIRTNKN